MIPDTISSLEIVRCGVALYGIRAAWRGRQAALASRQAATPGVSADIHERSSQAQRGARMRLFEMVQTGILLVHLLLLVNVLINFGYASAPVEQPNVVSSNVAQILIPFILIRLSEMVVLEMGVVATLRTVAGERPPSQESRQ